MFITLAHNPKKVEGSLLREREKKNVLPDILTTKDTLILWSFQCYISLQCAPMKRCKALMQYENPVIFIVLLDTIEVFRN